MTSSPKPIIGPQSLERMRCALADSAYTQSQIEASFGRSMLELVNLGYDGALSEIAGDEDPQHVLMRLFLAGEDELEADVEHFCGLPVAAMVEAGILERVADRTVRARIRVQPHHDWWAFSDQPLSQNGRRERDVVPTVGRASKDPPAGSRATVRPRLTAVTERVTDSPYPCTGIHAFGSHGDVITGEPTRVIALWK